MPDFSAAVTLLKKPIEDLYTSASGSLKEKLAILKAASRVKELHKRLWETQRVKTIWQTDRPLSLSSFYYPVSVVKSDPALQNNGTRLTSLDDLPDNHNIIFGTVGQGKSILLRYLLGEEIKSGIRIPILFELRNVEKSLTEHLAERFSILLGLKHDVEVFEEFASAGKIAFFLDGFDEIDPVNLKKITGEIENLSFEYSACRIIVSSRPDSDCKTLTSFHTNSICPLNESDLKPFYKKITREEGLTSRLIAAISVSPSQIKELVRTPLLATLLAISYKAAHRIPLDFSEFYDELFQILLVRHDGSKLGWRRQRKTKLNDREIQQVFEAFCFATRRKQVTALDKDSCFQLATESLVDCTLEADATHFVEDIRKVTCLLVDEGKKTHFVHASVQEFFAARYVKTRTEPVARRFYAQVLDGKWRSWRQELLFLFQIDEHRSTKYFKLPDLDRTMRILLERESIPTDEHVKSYLSLFVIKRGSIVREGKSIPHYYFNRTNNTYWLETLDNRVMPFLWKANKQGRYWYHAFKENPTLNQLNTYEILLAQGSDMYADVKTRVLSIMNHFIAEQKRLTALTTRQETTTSFMDLS